MIFDGLIDEVLADIRSARLDEFEGLEESLYVPRNIQLLEEGSYRFREVRVGGDVWPFTCVDGGNATVMGYGGLVVEFNKVAGVEFSGVGRLRRHGPYKFLSLTYISQDSPDSRRVDTKIYHCEEGLRFAPRRLEPRLLRAGSETILTGRARRVMERLFASHLVSELGPRMLVLDGSLVHANDRAEIDALDGLLEKALERGVIVGALTKSSSINHRGEPLTHRVDRLARRLGFRHFYVEVGYARRGGKGFETRLYVVRLNSLAKKAYILEVFNVAGEEEVSSVVRALAANSNNVALPGYPQALAWADISSRIREAELDALKIAFRKRKGDPVVDEAFAHMLLDSLG